jgi:dTDP-4-dehydrorhamnose 3,5-epimerase
MIVKNSKLQGIKLFTPKVHYDDRGFFLESYNKIIQDILNVTFVQDNHSNSKKYVIRGLHYQWEPGVGKLVRVVYGEGLDVVVDLRTKSPTYGHWESFFLSENNFQMVWIPNGFAHGFLSLKENTHLTYKTSGLYNSKAEGIINPLCPYLNINWTIPPELIKLSTKDMMAQSFKQYKQQPKY